jgi:hypothetical protein
MQLFRHVPIQHPIAGVAGMLGVRSTLRRLSRSCFAPGGGEHSLVVAAEAARLYVYSESNVEAPHSRGGERAT